MSDKEVGKFGEITEVDIANEFDVWFLQPKFCCLIFTYKFGGWSSISLNKYNGMYRHQLIFVLGCSRLAGKSFIQIPYSNKHRNTGGRGELSGQHVSN